MATTTGLEYSLLRKFFSDQLVIGIMKPVSAQCLNRKSFSSSLGDISATYTHSLSL